MSENVMEDNTSVNSDDSTHEANAEMEKLEYLLTQESKHSQNFHELLTRDHFTKSDIENLNNSCQCYEEQKKKKSEKLEEYYDKLLQKQRENMSILNNSRSSAIEQLAQIDSLFCEAYDDYKSDVLSNTISYLDNETKQFDNGLLEIIKTLNNRQGAMYKSLMKPKSNSLSAMNSATNLLSEYSMKRPEIELEELSERLEGSVVPNLREQLKEFKSKRN